MWVCRKANGEVSGLRKLFLAWWGARNPTFGSLEGFMGKMGDTKILLSGQKQQPQHRV